MCPFARGLVLLVAIILSGPCLAQPASPPEIHDAQTVRTVSSVLEEINSEIGYEEK
jgi:hypothetical protein